MANDATTITETSEDRVRMELTKWAVSSIGTQTTQEPEPVKKKKDEESAETKEIPESKEK